MKNQRFSILPGSNNSAAGTSPAAQIELLRQVVRIAEKQLGQALQGDRRDPHHDRLCEAEAAAKVAEANWQQAWEASQRMPGIIEASELDRLHLTAEVARLRVAEARYDWDNWAANLQSAWNHVQSQLRALGEEVHRLRDHVDMLFVRN